MKKSCIKESMCCEERTGMNGSKISGGRSRLIRCWIAQGAKCNTRDTGLQKCSVRLDVVKARLQILEGTFQPSPSFLRIYQNWKHKWERTWKKYFTYTLSNLWAINKSLEWSVPWRVWWTHPQNYLDPAHFQQEFPQPFRFLSLNFSGFQLFFYSILKVAIFLYNIYFFQDFQVHYQSWTWKSNFCQLHISG